MHHYFQNSAFRLDEPDPDLKQQQQQQQWANENAHCFCCIALRITFKSHVDLLYA